MTFLIGMDLWLVFYCKGGSMKIMQGLGFMMFICVARPMFGSATQQYYGKNLYALCQQNTQLDTAVYESQWDTTWLRFKSLFSRPSQEAIGRMKGNISVLQETTKQIDSAMREAQGELEGLQKQKNSSRFWVGNGTNPGLEVPMNILLFPVLAMSHCASQASFDDKIRQAEGAINTMSATKNSLMKYATQLNVLVQSGVVQPAPSVVLPIPRAYSYRAYVPYVAALPVLGLGGLMFYLMRRR